MHQDNKKEDQEKGNALPIEPAITETENDADDAIHQQTDEIPAAPATADIDELVHQHPSAPVDDPTKEIDPDDRVHEADKSSFGSE